MEAQSCGGGSLRVGFFGINYNHIMKRILVIREGRILLQEDIPEQKGLSLKISIGSDIHKIPSLTWNTVCHRWELPEDIKLAYLLHQSIEIQLYCITRKLPKVIGEATIDLALGANHLEEELKIVFKNEGIIRGWLYCLIVSEGNAHSGSSSKFLEIDKIRLMFSEEQEDEIRIVIFQNEKSVYEKSFVPIAHKKTLFPNIKSPIRFSDLIRICILSSQNQFKTIQFLVDNIQRGKSAQYDTWIRNKYNNKAGELKLHYFLENLFLANERHVLSPKNKYLNYALSRMSTFVTETTNENNEKPSEAPQKTQLKIEEIEENQHPVETSTDPSSYTRTRETNGCLTNLNRTIVAVPRKIRVHGKDDYCLKKWKTNSNLAKGRKLAGNNFYQSPQQK